MSSLTAISPPSELTSDSSTAFLPRSLKVDSHFIKLQIWDTAGQERFKGITKTYYKGANAILLVYDVNNPKSYEDFANFWLQEANNNTDEALIFCLINKCDNPDTTIPTEQVDFLKEKNIPFFQVSAKTGYNIADGILEVVRKVVEVTPKQKHEELASKQLNSAPSISHRKKCCNR